MDDPPLEGVKQTRMQSDQVAKQIGQVEEDHIYRGNLSESGSFNIPFVIRCQDDETLVLHGHRHNAFVKQGTKHNKAMTKPT